jgi:lincosamide nucleotidyltransferase A/C/D/E
MIESRDSTFDASFEAGDVVGLVRWLRGNGIDIWVDGGWCVDALLGRQTRAHRDLDIAVSHRDNPELRRLLLSRSYAEEYRDGSAAWMYVMKAPDGKEVDVHVFEYDERGNNIYGIEYPFGALTGTGVIDGQEVSCISAEWMFRFKTAYQPQEKDLRDVQALAERYGYIVPDTHRE